MSSRIRLAAVQWEQRRISGWEEFAEQVAYFVAVAAEAGCDFVLFPEHFTLQLLSAESVVVPANRVVERLHDYTEALTSLFRQLAQHHRLHLVGGSHPCLDASGRRVNRCLVALRNGALEVQDKLHPTPDERDCWGIVGGDRLTVIETDCARIGVLLCYDCEFPELARNLVDRGVELMFVPFCTFDRQGYLRVRYCCQARAVENQVYLALAGNVGNLPRVNNMDVQYAQSCLLTPSDFPFARDGLLVEAPAGVGTLIMGDVDLTALRTARQQGTVQNLRDRRPDLYEVVWKGPS